ncbi:MAG TPA: TerC/Alx family metal homeostasis membrane protein [Kofleriaceae bacterium]
MPRSPTEPTTRSALGWTAFWFALAALFGAGLGVARGGDSALQFFTAYFVEQALSVDNLFVMMLVFARFRVPKSSQRRVLTWGIIGVIVLRGAMIFAGTALVAQFHVLTYLLGALLLVMAWRLARTLDEPEAEPEVEHGRIPTLLERLLPISDDFDGDRFTTLRAGARFATPLLVALVTIELADAVFALDSIPAVFGVTTDPLIAFTSNLFAVLGLRSLYFALAGMLDRLTYLKHGLVGVLGIVGAKMLVAMLWPVPTWLSLVLVSLVLGGAIVASLVSTHTSRTHVEQS